ncbi:hypothetical protein H4219_006441, partial [Mycoemilia scoparia]
MAALFFMDKLEEFSKATCISQIPSQSFDPKLKLISIDEATMDFIYYRSENDFLEYFSDLIEVLTKRTSEMAKYIVDEKQYTDQFKEIFEAGKSLLSQVKDDIGDGKKSWTEQDLLFYLWKLNIIANIVFVSYRLLRTLRRKANIRKFPPMSMSIPDEYVDLMIEIDTLRNDTLNKANIRTLTRRFSNNSPQDPVEYLPEDVLVVVGEVSCSLKGVLEKDVDSLYQKGGSISSTIARLLKWKTTVPQFVSANQFIDFAKTYENLSIYEILERQLWNFYYEF